MRVLVVALMLWAGLWALAVSASVPEADPQQGAEEAAPSPPGQSQSLPPGQQLSHWFGQAARAYQAQDIENWVRATKELHALRPYNQDFMRQLVEGNARLGNLSEAFEMMLTMQQQGLAVDWDRIDAVEPLREHKLYDYLNDLMTEAGKPFGAATTWSILPAAHAMPEAMAIDERTGRVFVGTIQKGEILVSADGDSWQLFASPESVAGLTAVFDLAVDAQRGHLWVATGKVAQYQGPEEESDANSALLRLDLDSGKLQQAYPLNAGGGRNLIGSLVVAGDGTVFSADTQSPVIYRLEPGSATIAPVFAHPGLTSLRGIALNGDDSLLYVADYEMGILVIDATGAQQAWQLAVPDNLNIGGVDGLYWWNNHLIAIQNAISPQRVLRLALGPDGLGVTSVAPLVAALEAFDTPTFGAMNGQILYFLAASHWPHVDPQGNPAGTLPDVPIMTVDVDSATVQAVGQSVVDKLNARGRAKAADQNGD